MPLCALLLACQTAAPQQQPVRQAVAVQTVSLRMAPSTNENRPVSVELARVPTTALVEELLAMDTGAWFGEPGDRFRNTHADGVYDFWEMVPGEDTGPFDVRVPGRHAAVLFCDVGGRLPMRFERDGDVLITVSNEGCTIAGGCASREPGVLDIAWAGRPCAGRRGPRSVWPANVRYIAFETSERVNRNAPVAVELVRTGDDELLEELLDITTDGWFSGPGHEFRLARPDLLVDRWELPPGGSFGPYDVRAQRGLAAVLFCRTPLSPGPVLLDPSATVTIDIDDGGCAPAGAMDDQGP